MSRASKSLPVLAAVLCIAGTGARDAAAQSVEQFYKGRTVTLLVGVAPGGLRSATVLAA